MKEVLKDGETPQPPTPVTPLLLPPGFPVGGDNQTLIVLVSGPAGTDPPPPIDKTSLPLKLSRWLALCGKSSKNAAAPTVGIWRTCV